MPGKYVLYPFYRWQNWGMDMICYIIVWNGLGCISAAHVLCVWLSVAFWTVDLLDTYLYISFGCKKSSADWKWKNVTLVEVLPINWGPCFMITFGDNSSECFLSKLILISKDLNSNLVYICSQCNTRGWMSWSTLQSSQSMQGLI